MSTQAIEPRMELEQHLHMYRQMAKIRDFEEQVNELYKGAKMPGLAHLYVGEEAVAVGVCEALKRDDFITSTHRGHGHCLAKGASVNRMFAELLGKEPGYCRGKGGSMHIADPRRATWAPTPSSAAPPGSPPAQRCPRRCGAAARSPCASSATARSARACSTNR